MQRNIMNKLVEWKDKEIDMPLMVVGARQVGKTYSIKKFCESNFDEVLYINLERDKRIVDVFEETIKPKEIIEQIELIMGLKIVPENIIIFIDEIQVSERAITSLKYFNESEVKYKVICAGSLLGVALNRFKSSYPVGKVRRVYMYPMDFEEFLYAFNRVDLVNEIRKSFHSDKALLKVVHELILEYYKEYLYVGGMPAAVKHHVANNRDLALFENEIKANIIEDYISDMSKYTTSAENMRIKKIYASLPNQLGRDNNKFSYKIVDEKAKKARYETSIDWLVNSQLVSKCLRIETATIPLKRQEMDSYFKLFVGDVGLLAELAYLEPYDIILDNNNRFKGMITENYVAQTFISSGIRLNYWRGKRNAEVDFVIKIKGNIIPVEVKANQSTKSKSLQVYMESYKPEYGIRISAKNFGFVNNIKSVPLYAVHLIKELM